MYKFVLKSIYVNRIKILKTEINKTEIYLSKNKTELENYTNIVLSKLQDMDNISNDNKIDSNIKYIQLTELTNEVEKLVLKIESIKNDILEKVDYIINQKNIIINNCIEDNPNISEEIVKESIDKYFL